MLRYLLATHLSGRRRALYALISLSLAAAIWLPCAHLLFRPEPAQYLRSRGIPPVARALAARHLELWSDPALRRQEVARMRASNAEWDFMGRTFLVLALANMALREPGQRGRYLAVMDSIIDETLRLEREQGMYVFLMGYARNGSFKQAPARSLFVDGEIALMLAVRRLVQPKPGYVAPLRRRVDEMARRMRAAPVRCVESYPDECWTFCNAVALAAIKIADVLDGTDHSGLLRRWVQTARRRLIHRPTGLLVSSFSFAGELKDGPEGSSIWMAAHALQLVDPVLARDQYARARAALGRSLLGFGYAREWPASWRGPMDVDSGAVLPLLQASPSSSGLALLAAAAFGDSEYFSQLITTLHLAGFPVWQGGRLRFAASNQVGDAVLLYATVQGPVWARVRQLEARP